jgi:hypothetical protein
MTKAMKNKVVGFICFGLSLLWRGECMAFDPFIYTHRLCVGVGLNNNFYSNSGHFSGEGINFFRQDNRLFYGGLHYHARLRGGWETEIKVMPYYSFSVSRPVNSLLGVNAGIYYDKHKKFSLEDYFYQRQPYTYHSGFESEHFEINEIGFYAGPVFFSIVYSWNVVIKPNIGFGSLSPFEERIFHKHYNSNYRGMSVFESKRSYSLFFFPEVYLSKDLFDFSGMTLGLQIQASYYYSRLSVNYTQSTYEWTKDNVSQHFFRFNHPNLHKYNLEFGVYGKIRQM